MEQKLHLSLVQAVIKGLTEIFRDGKYADKVIEQLLKSNPKWGARDRAFLAETLYDMVRYWRRYWAILGKEENLHPADLWRLVGIYWLQKKQPLPQWKEFNQIPTFSESRKQDLQNHPAIWHSYPEWMYQQGISELEAERWHKEMAFMNYPAEVVLRVNTLKVSPLDCLRMLREEEIECYTTPNIPTALRLKRRQNIFKNPLFQKGFFEVQDAGSQLIAPFLKVQPGMRVVDACAGAGGKSLHLAALMENKGKIISMDVEAMKLQELKKRAARGGVSLIETRLIENNKTIKRLKASADAVLLDVPCSGIGVLRRNPDAKWKLSPEFLSEVRQTQAQILQTYSQMVKNGGTLVYATCSIFPSENDQQVTRFLSQPDCPFVLEESQTVFPSEAGFDGFYMARMKKTR